MSFGVTEKCKKKKTNIEDVKFLVSTFLLSP